MWKMCSNVLLSDKLVSGIIYRHGFALLGSSWESTLAAESLKLGEGKDNYSQTNTHAVRTDHIRPFMSQYI